MNNQNKMIYLLAFSSGFLSLSLEVIWVRIISFHSHSVPQAFSYTLALFLIGIAIGAHFGRKICSNKNKEINTILIGKYFFIASCVDIVLFTLAYFSVFVNIFPFYIDVFFIIAHFCIIISASIRGIVFPLVHHLGTQKVKSGKQISNVYFSNVLGSSIAPILISFVLLDVFSTQQVYFLVCILSFLIAMLCVQKHIQKILMTALSMACVLTIAVVILPEKLFQALSKDNVGLDNYPIELIENKHGFIQVYQQGDEISVWGANVYDGKFNTDLFNDSNSIERAYLLPIVKPNAENILIIGLSTGSWTRVLSTMPNVKKITVVEINPDYINLIKRYKEVAPLLQDKRIEFVIDDGRRWLRRHDEQFDIILMNTTWHWRAYSTNLLSLEFLTMINQHLKPNGVVLYNTTSSPDAYATAKSVFSYVYQYKNMALASDHSVVLPNEQNASEILSRLVYPENKQPVFKDKQESILGWEQINSFELTPYEKIDFYREPKIITDNNMITEYKYGMGL